MKPWLPSALAFLGLGLLQAVGAQGVSDVTGSLPDCAVECLSSAVLDSDCKPTDQECICDDKALNEEVTKCVTETCTIKESMTAKNVTERACGVPLRDQSPHLIRTAIGIGTTTGCIVIFRLAFKLWAGLGWALDDWFILATGIATAPSIAIVVHGTGGNGLGRDVWTLPFDTVIDFGYYFWIMAWLYFLDLALLKISILCFYLRIFPDLMVRRVLWVTLALTAAFGIAFVLAAIFQCTPVSYNWTRLTGEHDGKCVNITGIAWSNAVVNIVFDIWMLAIPLSQLRKLNLHWKRKVGVGLMFVVGTFVTIVSILRLRSLVTFSRAQSNPTWYNSDVSNWSVIEIGVGTICACMPTIRLALVRCFRIFRETTAGYSYNRKSTYNRASAPPHGRHQSRTTTSMRGITSRLRSEDEPELVTTPRVVCQKSFAVEYGNEDAGSMVPMREFVISGGSSDRSDKSERARSF